MADLKYDTEEMRKTAGKYREIAKDLNKVKEDLKKQISDLEAVDWRSDAGKAFMDMYEDSWATNVEKYIAVLKEMARLLERAAVDYEGINRYLRQIPEVKI